MNDSDFCSEYLRCPNCHGSLVEQTCSSCGAAFKKTLGILDLRWPRPSGGDTKTERLIEEMLKHYQSSSFLELSALVSRHHRLDMNRSSTLDQLGQQMMSMFQHQTEKFYTIPTTTFALDIGCGYGTSSIVLSRRFDWVLGLEPYLPVLLLAKKALETRGIRNVILVQAYAQEMPVRDECVDFAVAQNVIEHLIEVKSALCEVDRVLQRGGCFCGDSRNRYDLFFPEPHVKLRWVGLFPRKLQSGYVRLFKNVDYSEWHARLLSWRELRQCGREAFGRSTRIVLPLVSAYGQSSRMDKWIERVETVPVLRDLAQLFFPSLLLLAQSSSPSDSRA
ncbi:MAG: class I SAM-dependent methyltransferase [Steroidobacteraceae bacterium]